MRIRFEKDPSLPDADVLSILQTNESRAWTEKELEQLFAAIREHHRDWPNIVPKIPTKNSNAIQHKVDALKQQFIKDSTLPGADVLPLLQIEKWTDGDEEMLIECLREYGKDLEKIALKLQTKSLKAL